MSKKNKNMITDQFIAQNLIEIEKPSNNRMAISLIIAVILLVLVGGGLILYINRDKIDWEFKWPWNKKEEERPLVVVDDDKRKEKLDLVVPILTPREYSLGGIIMEFSDMIHTEKGFEFKINLKTEEWETFSVKADKIVVDGYAFDLNFSVDKVSTTPVDGTIKIAQTDLDRYGIISFSKLILYLKFTNLETEKEELQKIDLALTNHIRYDNEIKGLIEIHNQNDTKLSYYRVDTDKDNTYIYFHARNFNNFKKIIRIKKLLLNGEIYEYTDLNVEVYNLSQEIFYITIPKKDVKKVNNMTISFFIIGKAPVEKNDAIYITNEYSKEFVK